MKNSRAAVQEKGRLHPAESRRVAEVAEELNQTLQHIYEFYDGYDPGRDLVDQNVV